MADPVSSSGRGDAALLPGGGFSSCSARAAAMRAGLPVAAGSFPSDSPVQRVDVQAVLLRCVQRSAAARDGRGRRWAAFEARAAFADVDGELSTVDEMCVLAAVRLGAWLRQVGRAGVGQ